MKTTLIGMVTFGNLPFTRLAIEEIRRTTQRPINFFVIVGKPGDQETVDWLETEGIPHCVHAHNKGFPASLNDIYDYAWGHGLRAAVGIDHLIIAGNDIVPYPGAVDALIECAESTDYEWIASSQFDVKSLVERYPEARAQFEGDTCLFNHWDAAGRPTVRPWELHRDFRPPSIEAAAMRDCHNLCLFKRGVAEKIGYIDVNFFPAYFSDNDYNRRATLAGVKGCTLPHSAYFHFWSRTIHQGSGGSTGKHFANNQGYYLAKWGGLPGEEKWKVPFNDTGSLKIASRDGEAEAVKYWSGL